MDDVQETVCYGCFTDCGVYSWGIDVGSVEIVKYVYGVYGKHPVETVHYVQWCGFCRDCGVCSWMYCDMDPTKTEMYGVVPVEAMEYLHGGIRTWVL